MRAALFSRPLAVVCVVAALPLSQAALCSGDEMQTINDDFASASAPSGCTVTSWLTAQADDEFCGNSDCVSFVQQVESGLPDCEYLGVNVKDRVQDVLTYCDGLGSASGSKTGSDSSSMCTTDQLNAINTTFASTTLPTDCYVLNWLTTETDEQFCADSQCVAFLQDVNQQLPDCQYLGVNVKDRVVEAVAYCDALDGSNSTSTSSTAGSQSVDSNTDTTPTPAQDDASAATGDNAAVGVSLTVVAAMLPLMVSAVLSA